MTTCNNSYTGGACYDKISGTVGYYGSLILKHEVKLNKVHHISRDTTFFHKEYEYSSNKYIDVDTLRKIDLQVTSYLLLSVKNKDIEWTDKRQIYLNSSNIYSFIRQLEMLLDKFYTVSDMFVYVDNKLVMAKDYNFAVTFELFHTRITLEPTVHTDDNGIDREAINVYINDNNNFSVMNLTEAGNLLYTLKNFDLYNSGLQLLNYFGRPPAGTGLFKRNASNTNFINNSSDRVNGSLPSNYFDKKLKI